MVLLVNLIENINLKIYKLEFCKGVTFVKLLSGIEEQIFVVWDNNNKSNGNNW